MNLSASSTEPLISATASQRWPFSKVSVMPQTIVSNVLYPKLQVHHTAHEGQWPKHPIHVDLQVTNDCLSWIDRIVVGWAGYVTAQSEEPPNESLLARLAVDASTYERTSVGSEILGTIDVGPLQSWKKSFTLVIAPPLRGSEQFEWRGALFLLPDTCPASFWSWSIRGSLGSNVLSSELEVLSAEKKPAISYWPLAHSR